MLLVRPVSKADASSKTGIAKGYIYNTVELGIANEQLRKIRQWIEDQRKLYEVQDGTK